MTVTHELISSVGRREGRFAEGVYTSSVLGFDVLKASVVLFVSYGPFFSLS